MDSFFDFTDDDFCFGLSDNLAMDSEGHLLARMSDNSAIDMETGELHIISSWRSEESRNIWDDDENDF